MRQHVPAICVLLEGGDVSTSVPAAPVMLSHDVSGQYVLKGVGYW